jgi:hypothetical protein
MIERPEMQEYNAFYAGYIGLVPAGDVEGTLLSQFEHTMQRFAALPEDKSTYRYETGKWSVAEVLGHITDTERVMSYRLLRVARGDRTPLPGFDQDVFVLGARFDEVPTAQLLSEYEAVRRSTLALLKGMSNEALAQVGNVNQFDITCRALVYIIAGHERHHLNVLAERYHV